MIINNPPYEKTIEHNGKEVTVHLWKNEEIGQLEDYPMYHITSEDVFLAGAKVNS